MKIKKRFLEKIFSIFSTGILLMNSFLPYLPAVTVNAQETSLQSEIKFNQDKYSFELSVNTNEKISYLLAYKTPSSIEGTAPSTVEKSDSNFYKEIYAGIKSGDDARKDEVVRGIFKVKVDTQNWFDSKRFTFENGSLKVVDDSTTGSLDISPEDTNWLETGSDVIEQLCTDSSTLNNNTYIDWNIDTQNNIAETKEKVQVGVTYIFPLENKVTVKFNCLPKNEALRTTLKIQQVRVSDLKLPQSVNPATEYAYDITTGMKDGSFKYEVSLPKSSDQTAEISYIEKSIDDVKANEVTTSEVKQIEDNKIEQANETVKATGLDHFTIYITTYADIGLTVSESTYLQGDTVYTNSTGLDTSRYYRVDILQGTTVKYNVVSCTTNVTNLTGSYTLSPTEQVGTNWSAVLTRYNSSSDCSSHTTIKETATDTFEIKATTPTPLDNPSLPQVCGLDIALVIDNSNSISNSELNQMKTALKSFVNALSGTPTQFSVTKFGTNASVVHAFTSNTTDTNNAIDSVSTGGGGTDWKKGISTARSTFSPDPRASKPNLMIFASDGNPTYPNCGGATTCAADVNAAVTEANTTKQVPIRILALGIGDGLLVENLKAISGHVVNDSTIMGSDVITTDFAGMATKLATFASQTCGGTISVNKYVDSVQKSDGQTWSFKIDGTTTLTTDPNGQVSSGTLSVGNHSVSEVSIPAGYSYDHATCTNGTADPANNGVKDIAITADSIITCSFYNTTNKGSIELKKAWVGTAGQTTLNIGTTAAGTQTASVQTGAAGAAPLTTGTKTVNTGTYYVSETGGLTNYNSSLACTDNGSPVTPGASNSLSVAAGHAVICTYTNALKNGMMILKKSMDGGTGSFVFSGTGPSGTISTNNGTITVNNVTPGNYDSIETIIPGWTISSIVCDDGASTTPSTTSIGARAAFFKVDPGETVTCTFTNSKLPTLTVNKVLSPSSDPGKFNLQIDSVTKATDVGDGGTTGAQQATIGSHTVGEIAGTGTSLSDYASVIGGDCATNGTITLAAGDNKICTFTNTRNQATIELKKVWSGTGGQTTLNIGTSADGTQVDTQQTGVSGATPLTTGQNTVNTGTYYMSETGGLTNYTTSALSCFNDANNNGVNNSEPAVTVGTNDSVAVTSGQHIICIYTNTRNQGKIELQKDFVGAPENVTIKIGTAQNGSQVDTDVLSADGTDGEHTVDTGTYFVSETLTHSTNYTSGLACYNDVNHNNVVDGGDTSHTVNTGTGSLTISANDDVICVFTNTRNTGSITIDKVTNPAGDTADFNFNILSTDTGINQNFTLKDQDTPFNHSFETGVYKIEEKTLPTGWSLTDLVCNSSATIDKNAHTAIFDLDNNENITCTFTNTKLPTLTVNKILSPVGHGEFNLKIDGTTYATGVGNGGTTGPQTLSVGSHTFSEEASNPSTVIGDYIITYGGNAGCNNDGTITLAAGENKTCTITNTAYGSLTIVKDAVPNDSQDFSFTTSGSGLSNFDLDDDSDPTLSNSRLFSHLVPGTYGVSETPVTGWDLAGTTCSDASNVNSINISTGENVTCTFTNTKRGSISGYKYEDADGNPVTTNDRTPISNWLIKLYDNVLAWVADAWTNASGFFIFLNLTPGNYEVREVVPTQGWTPLLPTGIPVPLTPGQNSQNNNFVNTELGKIIIEKQTTPNTETTTEFTFSTSYKPNFNLKNMGTDDSGFLMPGNYTATESAQTGWDLSNLACTENKTQNTTTDFANATANINLDAGETVHCTFDNTQRGSISGHKWEDLNADGYWDNGEPVVNGQITPVQIFVDVNNNGTYEDPPDYYGTIDNLGRYSFGMLIPGTYNICERDNLLTGWTRSYPVANSCQSIQVNPGLDSPANFGNYRQATINVTKDVLDADGNNVSDTHQFTVQLNSANNKNIFEGQNPITSYIVNPGGPYTISELNDSDYDELGCFVEAAAAQTPATNLILTSNQIVNVLCKNKQIKAEVTIVKDVRYFDGTDTSDSAVFTVKRGGADSKTFSEGNNAVYNLNPDQYTFTEDTQSGYTLHSINPDNDSVETNGTTQALTSNQKLTITFTNYQNSSSISGYKYEDSNGALPGGTQTPVANWLIQLYDNVLAWVADAWTNASGFFNFDNLIPGNYFLREEMQTGWTGLSPTGIPVTLTPGQNSTNNNFVNFKLGKITVCKYNDINGNGSKDGGEPELNGVTVHVEHLLPNGQFNSLTLTGVTGAIGNPTGCYVFNGLEAGDYQISETVPSGFYQTYPNSPNYFVRTIQSGSDINDVYFLNTEYRTISGTKYHDLNNNGTRDAGEPGLEDWTIYLDNNFNGQLNPGDPSTLTDADGYFQFNNLSADTYRIREDLQSGWTQTEPITGYYDRDLHSVPTSSGNVFGNINFGQIIVTKYNDLDGNGIRDNNEKELSDWEITLTGNSNKITDNKGQVVFDSLVPNDYYLGEVMQEGWQQTAVVCTKQEPEIPTPTPTGEPGESHYACRENSCVQVEGNGTNTCQVDADCIVSTPTPTPINIGLCHWNEGKDEWNALYISIFNPGHVGHPKDYPYDGPRKANGHPTNDGDDWCKENYVPKTSLLNQILGISTVNAAVTNNQVGHLITVNPGDQISCEIGNQYVTPKLTIAKSNNATGDKSPGDHVTYQITINALDNKVLGVKVKDLLPPGFSFDGTWKVSLNGVEISVPNPIYASPGTWNLGDMNKNDEIIIEYSATISGDKNPGLYKDVAWAAGSDAQSTLVLALAQTEGFVDTNFVGTEVRVVKDTQNYTSVNIEKEGEVLGVSLPATGGKTIWMIIASIASLLGLLLVLFGLALKKGRIKILSKFFALFLVILTYLLIAHTGVMAADLSIRLSEPKSPTHTDNFDLNFVALDLNNNPIIVQCFYKKEGASYNQFGSDINLAAGGNNGSCQVTSAQINESGKTYSFYAQATSASGSVPSDTTVTVDYNTSGPGTPTNYSKEETSDCEYKIKFKSADDSGKTVKIEIYRSDNTSFSLDAGTRVGDIGIGSNTDGSFSNTVPDCSKTYYYAVRAFDSYGNGSGWVGDSVVKATTTTTTAVAPTSAAIPVVNVTLPSAEVLGEKTTTEEAKEKLEKEEVVKIGPQALKNILGAATKKENRPYIIILAVIGLGIIGYAVYIYKKNNKA